MLSIGWFLALAGLTTLGLSVAALSTSASSTLLLRKDSAKWHIHYAQHGNHSYFVFDVGRREVPSEGYFWHFQSMDSNKLDFFKAEAHCNKFNAHLASFHNVDELDFISALTPSMEVWLGLYHAGECLYVLPNYKLYFTDGSTYPTEGFSPTAAKHFLHWHSAKKTNSGQLPWSNDPEPNHHFSQDAQGNWESEYCVGMNQNGSARLMDRPCATKLAAHVCKLPLNGTVKAASGKAHQWDAGLFQDLFKQLDEQSVKMGTRCSNNFIREVSAGQLESSASAVQIAEVTESTTRRSAGRVVYQQPQPWQQQEQHPVQPMQQQYIGQQPAF